MSLIHLSDVTSFERVMLYVQQDDAIDGAINVGNEDLGDVAQSFFDGDADKVRSLIESGAIGGDPIPLDNAVDCIRLEPYYLVKDTNTKYK